MNDKGWLCIKTRKKLKRYHTALKEFQEKKGNLLVMVWKKNRKARKQ